MATQKEELILDKRFQVDLRTVYIMIASTAVAVASVLGVYYNFSNKLDKLQEKFTYEHERRMDLENTVRDLEKRMRDVEKK